MDSLLLAPARIQSPSSINTYRQCPRKYYYRYLLGMPSQPSIHLIRGSVTHLALEQFFETDVAKVPDGDAFFFVMKVILNETFRKEWRAAEPQLASLGLSPERLLGYYDETKLMLENFFEYFTARIRFSSRFMPIKEAWEATKPEREVELASERHAVRGFLDAVHKEGEKTLILDYKTSRHAIITPDYELQLGIYAMLYEERRHRPDLVGIFFLREGKEELLDVTSEMIERARREIIGVHLSTQSKEVRDYPKRPSPLCKWSTGQCDYYAHCFEGRSVPPPRKAPDGVEETLID